MSLPPVDPHFIVVHGIGPFEASDGFRDRLAQLLGVGAAQVIPFNWDQMVQRPSPTNDTLSDLASSMLTAADLGFRGSQSAYVGLSGFERRIVNDALMLFRITWLLGAPVALFAALNFDTLPLRVWGTIIIVLLGSLALVCPWKGIAVRALVRSVVLTAIWPTCHLAAAVVAYPAMAYTVLGVGLLLVMLPLSSNPALMMIAAIIVGALWAASIQAYARLPPILLKLLADVFRYLASDKYRNQLQKALEQTIVESRHAPGGLVIMAHSLGSVIAVDTLVNMAKAGDPPQVMLITMGSPLKQLFQRFFPEIWPAVADVCRYLQTTLPRFSWSNIYRRFDYVGRALRDGDNSAVVDLPTGQNWPAHLGYWHDPRVISIAKAALASCSHTTSPSAAMDLQLWPHHLCATRYQGFSDWLWGRRAVWLLSLLTLAVAPLALAALRSLHWQSVAIRQGVTPAGLAVQAVGFTIELLVVGLLFPTAVRFLRSAFGSTERSGLRLMLHPMPLCVSALVMGIAAMQWRTDSQVLQPLGNRFDGPAGPYSDAIHSDGRYVAMLSDARGPELVIIDARSGQRIKSIAVAGGTGIMRVKADMTAAAILTDYGAAVDQISPTTSRTEYSWRTGGIGEAISADLTLVGQVSSGAIVIRDLTTGRPTARFRYADLQSRQLPRVDFTGDHLAALFDDTQTVAIFKSPLWDRSVITGVRTEVRMPFGPETVNLPRPWALSPDGRHFVGEPVSGDLTIWDLRGSSRRLVQLEGALEAATFDGSGRRFATYNAPGILRLWDTDTGRELTRYLQFSMHPVSQLFLAEDASSLLTVSLGYTLPVGDGTIDLPHFPLLRGWILKAPLLASAW